MRILFLITGLGMGGAERQVCDLADCFVSLGHDIQLVYLTGEALVKPASSKVQVIRIGMRKHPWDLVKAYFKVRKLISNFSPDVVHSHMVHANLFARCLRLMVACPRLICTAHNTNEGGALRMLAYRLTDRLADLTTNVSDEAVESFVSQKAAPKKRMMTMYNGIDTSIFKYDPEQRVRMRRCLGISDLDSVIIAVGRFSEQKDYSNLLHAFSIIKGTSSCLSLLIVGAGELLEEMKLLSTRLAIHEHVRFLGIRRDIPELLCAADVFVLSSAWEGFGLVVAEAMACERVVVATDCGGVKEVVGDSGFLVPPRNATELATALNKALHLTASEKQAIGIAARKRIENKYSLKTIAEAWLKIYQNTGNCYF